MEHWLLKKETIYALVLLSGSEQGFSDESIEAAFRVRSRRKALELAQQAFYSSLEMYLFSSEFDIRGGESILAVQHRFANEYCPHDLPDEKSISPLLDIMKENATGRKCFWYRYLLCDVVSANLFRRVETFKTVASRSGDSSAVGEIQKDIWGSIFAIDKTNIDVDPEALFGHYQL